MRGACRLRQFWRFNLILTHCGFLGRTFGTHSILYCLIPAQLRKSGVVMDRHATLWLSEACGRCVSSAVCRWRASAKQSENSEHSEHSGWLADARAVVSRSWLSSSPPWRRWDVVCSGTACHRLRGGGLPRLWSSSQSKRERQRCISV